MEQTNPEILHDSSMELKAAEVLARREAAQAAANAENPTVREQVGGAFIAPPDMSQSMPQVGQIPSEPPAPPIPPVPQGLRTVTQMPKDDVIPPPPTEAEMRNAGVVTSGDDAAIITGDGKVQTALPPTTVNLEAAPVRTEEEDEAVILTGIANAAMEKVPSDIRESFVSEILPSIVNYRKEIIRSEGLTPAEATEAARNRMKKKSEEKATEFYKQYPDGVVLTIDKSQEGDLHIDEDMEKKLQRAHALKLIVVESEELKTLNVRPREKHVDMGDLRSICGSLSQYSVPLLATGDYATFYGAQSGALANATINEDDTLLDDLDKKASLIYEYFARSSNIPKKIKDAKGKEHDITYDEFCNLFAYDDIPMAIYAIVCASSMEVTESTYVCQNRECGRPYNISYNQKSMLDLSDLADDFKERVSEIDAARSSKEALKAIHEKVTQNLRVKSPVTKNIYELYTPSIADVHGAIELCQDLINPATAYTLVLVNYLDRVWIHDPETDSYIEIDVRADPRLAFDTLCHIHQVDAELLYKMCADRMYAPAFKVKSKCPHCGREATDVISIDNVLFLRARATLTEILQ